MNLKPLFARYAAVFAFGAITVTGMGSMSTVACLTKEQIRDVKNASETALTAAQIACVFASSFTDAKAVATACNIVDKVDQVMPLLERMIAQREGAKKAGVKWEGPSDAGSDASKDAAKE